MADKKVIDLNEEKRKKRGWTQKELEESALRDMREFDKIDAIEPDNFASGDPSKIYDDEDEDDERKE